MSKANYHQRQRQIEAGARKRKEEKIFERYVHASSILANFAQMAKETNGNMRCEWNPHTGKYTVLDKNTARVYSETKLLRLISMRYAAAHEVEMTDNIPEDDK